MNRVKVIKRGEERRAPQSTESDLRRQANDIRRRTADKVTDWISEWREQKEKVTADAVRKFLHPSTFVKAT